MLIDWFTVGAQVINFLVLVWLMKRYLYQPILRAIDAREKRIAAALSDAEQKKAEANDEREEFQRRNAVFEQQRTELMRKASVEASAEGQRLVDAARQAADVLSTQRQKVLCREQKMLKETLIRRTREEVFAIARKTLADLADTSLEASISEVFMRRLRALSGHAKAALATALNESSDPVIVRSAFVLPPAQRAALQRALNEIFSVDLRIDFVTTPDVISGIELTAGGQKLAWSISEYLSGMEQHVSELTQMPTTDEEIRVALSPDMGVGAESETAGNPE